MWMLIFTLLRHLVSGMSSLLSLIGSQLTRSLEATSSCCILSTPLLCPCLLSGRQRLLHTFTSYNIDVLFYLFVIIYFDNSDEPTLQLQTCNDSCGNDHMVKEHLRD